MKEGKETLRAMVALVEEAGLKAIVTIAKRNSHYKLRIEDGDGDGLTVVLSSTPGRRRCRYHQRALVLRAIKTLRGRCPPLPRGVVSSRSA